MKEKDSDFKKILDSLVEKGPVKIDVYQKTEVAFSSLRSILSALESDLLSAMSHRDNRVQVKLTERGVHDLEFSISDDILIFSMHSDTYIFPESHPIWKQSYLSDRKSNAYCGMISIYNFLTDSFKFQRVNDVGILIARIFINQDNHFFVEGKKQLGFRFNDFENDILTTDRLREVVETAVLFALETDIQTPPFDKVRLISVQELIEKSLASVVSTGKRLGFKFQSESDIS